MFLAIALNDFLIKEYGFKLYKDSEPESPLRTMTLKYDNHGVLFSLYPIEYRAKVLNYEANFEDLHNRIKKILKTLPNADELLDKMITSNDN